MKRCLAVVVAALSLTMLLVACGTSGPQTVEKVVTQVVETEKVVTQVVEVEKESTVVVEKVVTPTPGGSAGTSGGTLRVAIGGDIDNYDPHTNPLDLYEDVIRNTVYSALTRYDANQELQPGLAESWEISPDGQTYTFKLREGATFHNGQPVTAEDVQYTFDRIKTLGSFVSRRAQVIESIEVIDDYTISFHMNSPQGWWLHDATFVAIVPSGATTDTLSSEPIGSGPYMFKEWVPNDHITLERNPNYWDPDAVLVDEIVFRILPDVSSAIANLQSGEVDVIREASVVDAVSFLGSQDIRVVESPSSNFFHFYHMTGVNNEDILNNVNVRRALAHALNKDAIQRSVFLGQGEQIWSPVPLSNQYHISPEGYPYDPAMCRELLDAEGIQNLEFSVEIPVGEAGAADAEAMTVVWQAGLAECGVQLNINKSELSVWLDKYLTQNYDVTWNSIGIGGDPNGFFDLIIRRFADAGVYNNPEMEDLRARAKQTTDPAEATEMLTRMQEIINEDLPVILVQTVPNLSLTGPHVRDWKIRPDGSRVMEGVWLDQ